MDNMGIVIEFAKLLELNYIQESVQENSGWLKIQCPFAGWLHKKGTDETPSSGINVHNPGLWFNCFGCDQSGPLISIVEKLKQFGIKDSIYNKLKEILGGARDFIFVEPVVKKREYKFDINQFKNPDSKIISYLLKRNVNLDAINKYDIIRYGKDYMALPIKDSSGKVYGVTRRYVGDIKGRKRWLAMKSTNKKGCLFGAQYLKGGDDVIVVEGNVDVLYIYDIFKDYIPVCPTGSKLSDEQADQLKSSSSLTLIMDSDNSGGYLRDKIVKDLIEWVPRMFEIKLEKGTDPASTEKEELIKKFTNREIIRI